MRIEDTINFLTFSKYFVCVGFLYEYFLHVSKIQLDSKVVKPWLDPIYMYYLKDLNTEHSAAATFLQFGFFIIP